MFTQNLVGVVKVKSLEVKKIEKEGVDPAIVLEVKGVLKPNGGYVTVSKYIRLKKDLHEFIRDNISDFNMMVKAFEVAEKKEQSYYVGFTVKPSGNNSMFDSVTHDVLDDGREFLKISAFVKELPCIIKENKEGNKEEFIVYTYFNKRKEVAVSSLNKSIMEVSMIVVDSDRETGRLELCSGDNYPKTLIAYTDPKQGMPVVGQGYRLVLSFKSQKADAVVSNKIGWGEEIEESDIKAGANRNQVKTVLEVVGAAKIKGWNIASGGAGEFDDLMDGLA